MGPVPGHKTRKAILFRIAFFLPLQAASQRTGKESLRRLSAFLRHRSLFPYQHYFLWMSGIIADADRAANMELRQFRR